MTLFHKWFRCTRIWIDQYMLLVIFILSLIAIFFFREYATSIVALLIGLYGLNNWKHQVRTNRMLDAIEQCHKLCREYETSLNGCLVWMHKDTLSPQADSSMPDNNINFEKFELYYTLLKVQYNCLKSNIEHIKQLKNTSFELTHLSKAHKIVDKQCWTILMCYNKNSFQDFQRIRGEDFANIFKELLKIRDFLNKEASKILKEDKW